MPLTERTMKHLENLTKEQLIAKIAAMQEAAQRKVTFKVSEKGAVSAYGLGRFPVTLYAGQWERLAQEMPNVLAFIEANSTLVSRK